MKSERFSSSSSLSLSILYYTKMLFRASSAASAIRRASSAPLAPPPPPTPSSAPRSRAAAAGAAFAAAVVVVASAASAASSAARRRDAEADAVDSTKTTTTTATPPPRTMVTMTPAWYHLPTSTSYGGRKDAARCQGGAEDGGATDMMGRLGLRSTIDKAINVAGGEKKAKNGANAKQGQTRHQGRPYGIDVVLGSQWGDEGKGKLVDILSQVSPVLPPSVFARFGRRFLVFSLRFSASGSFSGGHPRRDASLAFFPVFVSARPPARRSIDRPIHVDIPAVGWVPLLLHDLMLHRRP